MHTAADGSRTPEIRQPPLGQEEGPIPGIGLCLSGGGYRAMLFHVGSLWRLNEAGCLPRIGRVSSVSGGSVTAAAMAQGWSELAFDGSGVAANYRTHVVKPLRKLASETIDVPAVLLGILTPGVTINRILARSYRRRITGHHTLADLPDKPEFVFDATSLQSGDLWRFSRQAEGDWRVGARLAPDTELSRVVAASSAFPPLLSPARFTFSQGQLEAGNDPEVSHPP